MTEQIEIIERALKKVKDQKENFGFMDRFLVDENLVVAEALEKQIPKKPDRGRCGVLCPTCSRQEYIKQIDALDIYCGFCGQRIDWSEE